VNAARKQAPEPVHARAVLAQLVALADGVSVALVLFVGAERKAATWLMQRGWAKRSRASSGEVMLAATAEGRAEHAKTAKPGDAALWLGHPLGRTIARGSFSSADVDEAYERGRQLGREDERTAASQSVGVRTLAARVGAEMAADVSRMTQSEPDLLDLCSCTHDYGAHNGRGPCARCKCRRFRSAAADQREARAELLSYAKQLEDDERESAAAQTFGGAVRCYLEAEIKKGARS
jgi:hypothetical protein